MYPIKTSAKILSNGLLIANSFYLAAVASIEHKLDIGTAFCSVVGIERLILLTNKHSATTSIGTFVSKEEDHNLSIGVQPEQRIHEAESIVFGVIAQMIFDPRGYQPNIEPTYVGATLPWTILVSLEHLSRVFLQTIESWCNCARKTD